MIIAEEILMKKVLSAICLLILLISLTVPAHATAETHLEELEMLLTLPSGYDVFTRNMDENDPLFVKYQMSKSQFDSLASSQNIYLDAFSMVSNAEIVVTMTPTSLESILGLSDLSLMSMGSMMVETFSQYGVTVQNYEVYHHPQISFLKVYYYLESIDRYSLQFYTINNFQAINITMHKSSGRITTALEADMEAVLSSVVFSNIDSVADASTPAFTYTDPELGVTFTVPENWQEKPLSEKREYLDIKFTNSQSGGSMILFGATDLWSTMSPLDKLGLTREDINMDSFSDSEIKSYLGDADSILFKRVSYNGIDFYHVEMTQQIDITGYKIDMTITGMLHIRDGWFIFFQFGGTSTDPLYQDFELLMKSVKIPDSEVEPKPTLRPEVPTSVNKEPDSTGADSISGNSEPPWALIILVIAAAVIILMVILIKRKRARRPVAEQPMYPQQAYYQPAVIYCPNCGAQLPESSSFCHLCGAKTGRN